MTNEKDKALGVVLQDDGTTNRSVVVCGVFNRPEPIPAIGPPAEFSGYGGRTPNPGAEA